MKWTPQSRAHFFSAPGRRNSCASQSNEYFGYGLRRSRADLQKLAMRRGTEENKRVQQGAYGMANRVKVEIYGQTYTLGGDLDEAYVQKLARSVDEKRAA